MHIIFKLGKNPKMIMIISLNIRELPPESSYYIHDSCVKLAHIQARTTTNIATEYKPKLRQNIIETQKTMKRIRKSGKYRKKIIKEQRRKRRCEDKKSSDLEQNSRNEGNAGRFIEEISGEERERKCKGKDFTSERVAVGLRFPPYAI